MEEKILAVSNKCKVGIALLVIAVIISVSAFAIQFVRGVLPSYLEMNFCTVNAYETWDEELEKFVISPECNVAEPNQKCVAHSGFNSPMDYAFEKYDNTGMGISAGIAAGTILICLFLYVWLHSYEITVTDKRVYGKAAFGMRVDLPVDQISSVATMWFKGVSVATSSGRIAFLMIKNQVEIHQCISKLLIERQNTPTVHHVATPVIRQDAPVNTAVELKTYKELLDSGVITQEEFDAKKKQLLGL